MKVLIADSDWHFAQQARTYLEPRAHLVVCEPRGQAAVERAARWQPELVIMSAELAIRDGIIESIYALNPRPAVLLTERMDRFDRAWRAWQKGGDELLIKPMLNIADLHLAIVTARENAAVGARSQKPAAMSA